MFRRLVKRLLWLFVISRPNHRGGTQKLDAERTFGGLHLNENVEQDKNGLVESKLLYHYTDQAGLDGILSSGCMWATHFKFLNDLSEREHGFDIFIEALPRLKAASRDGVIFSSTDWDSFVTNLGKTLRNYFEVTSSFLISFTTDSPYEIEHNKSGCDRLSQWRGYAFGKQGYCLGFDYAPIEEIGDRLHETIGLSGSLRPCIYEDEEKIESAQQIIEPILEAYTEEIKKNSHNRSRIQPFKDPNGKPMQIFKARSAHALFLYSLMKHASFDEEHETRLSAIFVDGVSDSNLVQYRDGKGHRVPYIEVPIGIRRLDSTLKRIVVGPSEQKEQRAKELQFHLQQIGLSKVEVVLSKIPYRNW